MMRSLRINPQAEVDLSEAFHWYQDQALTLGGEFFEGVTPRSIIRIMRRPMLALSFFAASAIAQIAPELGQGLLPEFDLAAKKILALAEATPEAKYAWRPAPGVRSTSEVFIHIAMANFTLLGRTGVDVKFPLPMPKDNPEKSLTRKEDVIKWLKVSFDAVRAAYPTADRQKKVKFFNQDTTAEGVFLRILVHNQEHMGQSIAYDRMNGIKPPWSE